VNVFASWPRHPIDNGPHGNPMHAAHGNTSHLTPPVVAYGNQSGKHRGSGTNPMGGAINNDPNLPNATMSSEMQPGNPRDHKRRKETAGEGVKDN
jgi:hypothetical protein